MNFTRTLKNSKEKDKSRDTNINTIQLIILMGKHKVSDIKLAQ